MDEITSIEEMVKGVLSQPPTDYFTFNPKDGYKIVQLDKEVWFFLFTSSWQKAEFIMRSKYQVASCKVSVFPINNDYDIGAFNQDVLQYFNGKVDKNNIIVKQIGSGFGNNLLVVAKQIFNQYQPI